jgi:hypothetical protein
MMIDDVRRQIRAVRPEPTAEALDDVKADLLRQIRSTSAMTPRSRRAALPSRKLRFAAQLGVGVGATLLLAGGVYAVPVTRAAVGDLFDAASGWVSGDPGSAPGRPLLTDDDAPSWIKDADGTKRVIAQADGQKLYAILDGDQISLGIGNSYGISGSITNWRQRLSGHKILTIGPGEYVADGRHDRIPLFGVSTNSVKSVRLDYAGEHAPVTADKLDGGFALTVNATWPVQSLTAYDSNGQRIDRLDISSFDFTYCPDIQGCKSTTKTG